MAFQDLVRRVPVPDHFYEFAVDLVRRTRPQSPKRRPGSNPGRLGRGTARRAVLDPRGKGPRRAARQLHGPAGGCMEVAEPVLVHRVLTTFAAESEGLSSRDIVRRLVDELSRER
jgi:MoxR-like ATPase